MDYKKLEEKHYDSKYSENKEFSYPDGNNVTNNDKVNIASRHYIESRAKDILKGYVTANILDFGCAIGEKTYRFSSPAVKITGIDISARSIEVARELARKYHVNGDYQVMDCESLEFEDSSFDIVYDFGTFSSINIEKAIPEICRVLKDDGYLVSIETLGNNPLLAIKRKLNVLSGSRTSWAASHIMKISDWKNISTYFKEIEIRYFSFLTIFLSPVLYLIPRSKHNRLINFFGGLDDKLLKYRFFQYFAFKTVAIMSKPKK